MTESFLAYIYKLSKIENLTRAKIINILEIEYKKAPNTARQYVGVLFNTGILNNNLGCITVDEELIRGLGRKKK